MEVENDVGPPAFMLESDISGLCSDASWLATVDGVHWRSAKLATEIDHSNLSGKVATPFRSLLDRGTEILLLFALGMMTAFVGPRMLSDKYKKYALPTFRLMLLATLGCIYWHNFPLVSYATGMDVSSHYAYLDYLLSKRSLPSAYDGWQMFQPPFTYLLNALVINVVHIFAPDVSLEASARSVTMGIALLTAYFGSRAVEVALGDRGIVQWFGVALAIAMPVAIYMAHTFGNEPYFAFLGVMIFYWIICHMDAKKNYSGLKEWTALGILCGLALLAKVTALILCAVVVLVLLRAQIRNGRRWHEIWKLFGVYCFWIVLIAGWWYLRNFMEYGRPFIGGWESRPGMEWWQYPGYRSLGNLYEFGGVLAHSIYAGVSSFLDGVYSSLWGDGYLSGIVQFASAPHWNFKGMQSLYLLALPIMFAIAVGMIRVLSKQKSGALGIALEFSALGLILLLGAMFYMYATIPIYSSAKASYMLVLVPGIAILAAWGIEPFDRTPISRIVIAGFMAVWVGSVYSSFIAV